MTSFPIVAGAGIAGLTLALALARRGFSPQVFEARDRDALTSEGAFLTLAPNAMHGLATVGLADAVVRHGVETTGIEIVDERGKRLGFMDQHDHLVAFGAPSVTIARGRLMGLMVEACTTAGIPLNFGAPVEVHVNDAEGVRVVADSREHHADWIACCEGLRSPSRRAVFPEYPSPRYTGLIGTGGIDDIDDVPSTEGVMRMVFGHAAFFGYLKVLGGPVHWFNSFPAEIDKEPPASIGIATLRHLHCEDPPIIDSIFSRLPTAVRPYPIYDMPGLPAWSRGRVVLVGDAAHAIGPHAGQGAGMAIEDAVALAACVANNPDICAFR